MNKMTKESKQLNWFLAIMVIGAIVYSCIEVIYSGTEAVRPPITIDVGSSPASDRMLRQLAIMSLKCDINDEVLAAGEDNILTEDEVLTLGVLCVEQAEAEFTEEFGTHSLDIPRNEHENKGGLSM